MVLLRVERWDNLHWDDLHWSHFVCGKAVRLPGQPRRQPCLGIYSKYFNFTILNCTQFIRPICQTVDGIHRWCAMSVPVVEVSQTPTDTLIGEATRTPIESRAVCGFNLTNGRRKKYAPSRYGRASSALPTVRELSKTRITHHLPCNATRFETGFTSPALQ